MEVNESPMMFRFILRSMLLSMLLTGFQLTTQLSANSDKPERKDWKFECVDVVKSLSSLFAVSGLGRPLSTEDTQMFPDSDSLSFGHLKGHGFEFDPTFRLAFGDDKSVFKVPPRLLRKILKRRVPFKSSWNVWAQKSGGKIEYYQELDDKGLVKLIEQKNVTFLSDQRSDFQKFSKPSKLQNSSVDELRAYQRAFIHKTVDLLNQMIDLRKTHIRDLEQYSNNAHGIEFQLAWDRANKDGSPRHLPSETIEERVAAANDRRNYLQSQVHHLEGLRDVLLARYQKLK